MAGSVGTGGAGGGAGTGASGGTSGSGGTGALGGVGGTGDGGGAGGNGGSGGCAQPPVAIAPGLANAYGIAVDDVNVYWTDNTSGTVMVLPKTGGTPQVLVSGEPNPQFIVLDAAHVYWNNGISPGGSIKRAAKTGGPAETVVAVDDAEDLALDATNVYFTGWSLGAPVMSAPLSGGPATILADAQPNPRQIAVYQGNVYWANQGPPQPGQHGSIMKVPATGGTPSVIASNEGVAHAIAVDASGIYWGDFTAPDKGLMTVPLTGGAPVNLASDPIDTELAIDDARVYFANQGGEIKSVPKTGGAICTIASGQPYPYMLAVDGEFVYWTNYDLGAGGSVWKASKDCCEHSDGGADAGAGDASLDGALTDASDASPGG